MEMTPEEDVVRALHAPFWDENVKRGTKSAFKQLEVSVCRTKILPYDDIVNILKRSIGSVEKPVLIKATAKINVSEVQRICSSDNPQERDVLFCADPVQANERLPENLSHALMKSYDFNEKKPKVLTNGLAQRIMTAASIQEV